MMKILIGNAFPLALIRRKVEIVPHSIDILKRILNSEEIEIYSFWGHENSLGWANEILGVDLTPLSDRPPVELNNDYFPILNNEIFNECWILSPDFAEGFRPAIGEEVSAEKIVDWHVLKIKWL